VGAIGLHWQIASSELVRTLGARLDAREFMSNGELDGLVVADLEMQIGVLLNASPVTTIEGVGADEV
jgi:hypothetical protein